MASWLWKGFRWFLSKSSEGLVQDAVVSGSAWKWARDHLLAFLGGGVVMGIVRILLDNWLLAILYGALFLVLLIYATAFIRALLAGKTARIAPPAVPMVSAIKQAQEPKAVLSASNSPSLPAQGTIYLHAPKARFDLGAIGIIRSVEIKLHFKPVRWECLCHVDFCGLPDGAEVSPRQLVMTEVGNGTVIATLDPASSLPDIPAQVTYRGWGQAGPRWRCDFESQGKPRIFCVNGEIRIPPIWRREHNKSRVRLDYELVGSGVPIDEACHPFFVQVANEPVTMSVGDAFQILASPEDQSPR